MGILDVPGITPAAAAAAFVGKPGARKAVMPLSAPNTTNAAAALDIAQRSILRFPFAVARWRVGIANRNLLSAVIPTTPFQVPSIWYGTPLYDVTNTTGNRWNGKCSGTMTQFQSTSLTVPVDGSRVWSDWAPSLAAGAEVVVSMGLTSTATGTGYATGNSYQAAYVSGAANAGVAAATPAVVQQTAMRLDVVVEYEFVGAMQHALVIGDSNSVSYSASEPQGTGTAYASSLPYESWPNFAGLLGGFAVTNLSIGSAEPYHWASSLPEIWNRIDMSAYQYDCAIIALGTNGIDNGSAFFQVQLRAILDKLRTVYGITRIFWATVPPRCFPDGAYLSGGAIWTGALTAPIVAGATTFQCSYSPLAGTTLVGLGFNTEDVTVTTVTGSGPYTATVSAAFANAHAVGEIVASSNERYRRKINFYLRNIPYGLSGLLDLEMALEASPSSWTTDPRLISSDYLHTVRAASLLKAQMAVALATTPKLL